MDWINSFFKRKKTTTDAPQPDPKDWKEKKIFFTGDFDKDLSRLIVRAYNVKKATTRSKADFIFTARKKTRKEHSNNNVFSYFDLSDLLPEQILKEYTEQKMKLEYKPLRHEKIYFIHDNGGRPFKVIVDPRSKRFSIYKNTEYPTTEDVYEKCIVKKEKYLKVFVPYYSDPQVAQKDFFTGNTMLFKLNKKDYLYAGNSVYRFSSNDEILKFFSPVGNNDVPYPVALTNSHVYMLEEHVKLPSSYFAVKPKEPFQYYVEMYKSKEYKDLGYKKFAQKYRFKKTIVR